MKRVLRTTNYTREILTPSREVIVTYRLGNILEFQELEPVSQCLCLVFPQTEMAA